MITTDGNRVLISGELGKEDSLRLLAAMHSLTNSKGYQDIILDFSACTKAFARSMLAICSQASFYWKKSIDISLILPTEPDVARLFKNTNWAHIIDFRSHDESRYRGYTHSPVIRFANGSEQTAAVTKILDILLAAISHFKRDDIRYMEWAVNEVTDNVINHAQSKVGGFVQVTNLRQREQIELVVADSGLGIPATLRPTHPELKSDTEALDAAIREGVTRDKAVGQGNGLYGTWSICQKTEGDFSIISNYASLSSPARGALSISQSQIPINGTFLIARIGYGDKFDLSSALTFSGRRHIPVDYIDVHFDQDESGNIKFSLADESRGFGSRVAGDPVRRKLANLLSMSDSGKLLIDMSGVALVSSSYADEVFGKLFLELGPIEFMRRVEVLNIDPLVRNLIDRAIMQRMAA